MSGHWWCQHCNQELSSSEVTFEENHSSCGGTAIWIEEEDIEEVEFLRKQLSEAGKRVDELYQENLTIKADMESNRQECCACSKERDELQAQVAVLRGALSADLRVFKNLNRYLFNYDEAIKRVENALSTTPAEAAERVNGLVEALEWIEKTTQDTGAQDAASDALADWRRGHDDT